MLDMLNEDVSTMKITGEMIKELQDNRENQTIAELKVRPELLPGYIPRDVQNVEALHKYIAHSIKTKN